MLASRVIVFLVSAVAVLGVSGCSAPWGCSDTATERGKAGARVQVVNVYGQKVGVVAKVVDWRLQPHPQSPDEGDRVHFHYRFDDDAFGSEHAVDVCAVDNERVALGCQIVSSAGAFGPGGIDTGDEWLSVEDPSQVAAVLMIPNDQSYLGRSCAQDAKDGGGPHPPAPAGVGDQL